MKKILLLFISSSVFLASCSQIRESAGVNRKNLDEFKVVENPPLIIPPDFNLSPPEQLSEKKIEDTESKLAKEIIFGLDDESEARETLLSTIDYILNQTDAAQTNENIRKEIDSNFALEKESNLANWNDEIEILNAISESERLRKKNLGIDNEDSEAVPTIKIENKKKKRFFFF